MRIKLDVTKSLEENAEVYFEKAKKSKRKLEGAKEAILKTEEKLEKAKEKKIEEKKREKSLRDRRRFAELESECRDD